MRFIFVASDQPGSKLIQWGLDSKSSHFAMTFDEDEQGGGIVFHSHGTGPQLEWLGTFLARYRVIHSLKFNQPIDLVDEESLYKAAIRQFAGEGYDYPAMLYWAWCVVRNKLFAVPFPAKNRWAIAGYALCTGLASGIPWIADLAALHGVDLEMIRPDDLCELLLSSGQLVDTVV